MTIDPAGRPEARQQLSSLLPSGAIASCVANFPDRAERPFAGGVGCETEGAAMSANGKILDVETSSGKARGNGDDALEDASLGGGQIVDDKDLKESDDPAASASTARAKDAVGDASRRPPSGKNRP